MHKKGAKLSPVHLFGLSKINRNYIQKGREIRRNEKNEKSTINRIITCNDFDFNYSIQYENSKSGRIVSHLNMDKLTEVSL